MALIDKLSAIGEAIRAKTGESALLTLDEMPIAIGNISGGGESEPIVSRLNMAYIPAQGLSSRAAWTLNLSPYLNNDKQPFFLTMDNNFSDNSMVGIYYDGANFTPYNMSSDDVVTNGIREVSWYSDLVIKIVYKAPVHDRKDLSSTGKPGYYLFWAYPQEEAIVIDGDIEYAFRTKEYSFLINSGRVQTKNVNNVTRCAQENTYLTKLPKINFAQDEVITLLEMFYYYMLPTLPEMTGCKVNSLRRLFYHAPYLRYIPDDFFLKFDVSNTARGDTDYMFYECYSLRSLPKNIYFRENQAYNYCTYYYGFTSCVSLDEIKDIYVYQGTDWNSNGFTSAFKDCARLKEFTFALQPYYNTPYICRWRSQTLDFTTTGFCSSSTIKSYILDYNSGITADKEVTDDETYEALKNDADWFTTNPYYSRYNRTSALNTINTIPDTMEFIIETGKTNTIKFKGTAGSKTDGGAINTLTEEEIAVATEKGWTVTMA